MVKTQAAPALPPGTEAFYNVSCNDVVMGRGSGTQNHCGNVTYRKLVYLNKELYATSSKFDKLKISKAIVAAVREFGGHFVQADDKRGGLYFDIGDKRAWDKTSQALREGQAEIRERLAREDPSGMSKVAEYKQVISEQTFFAYACKMLESLYHPANGESGITACGKLCPHAKRRQTLNELGVNPMLIHNAMQSLVPQPLPPPQSFTQQGYANMQQTQQPVYHISPAGGGANMNMNHQITPNSSLQPSFQGGVVGNSLDPLPYNAPVPGGAINYYDPLPYGITSNAKTMPGGSVATASTTPTYSSYPNSLNPSEASVPNPYQDTFEPLPYKDSLIGLQKPGLLPTRTSSASTVFSLRKFCSEDFEITSDEGKILMGQLNNEVDDLIRRKSHGLIEIDTTLAFEDLVFEEDSMDQDDFKEVIKKEPTERPKDMIASSSSSSGRNSGFSRSSIYSRMSRSSGLSIKDDISLMNMSILTLDEKEDNEQNSPMERSSSDKDKDGGTPKPCIRLRSGSDPAMPKNIRKRDTRVSFAAKSGMNVSLMSLDENSFGQLVDSISDPDRPPERRVSEMSTDSFKILSQKLGDPIRPQVAEKYGEVGQKQDVKPERRASESSVDSLKMSRKMGFPMRPQVAQKYEAEHPPTEVGQTEGRRQDRISSLTISEDPFPPQANPFPLRSTDFTELAGSVEKPSKAIDHSLNLGTSISNVSVFDMNMGSFNMSAVSLGDIDPQRLGDNIVDPQLLKELQDD